MTRNRILILVAAAALAVASVALTSLYRPAGAMQPPVYTGLIEGVAVGGYDPVAYFTEGKPVQGSEDITLQHEGVTWRFASEANRDAFKADPAKYAPQYGGYCAYAVSQGSLAKGDPQRWTIHDGKLYLNLNKSVQSRWEKDIPGYVKSGDTNWPGVLGN